MDPITTHKENTVRFSAKEMRKALSMVADEFTFDDLYKKMNERKVIGDIPDSLVRGRLAYMKKMRLVGVREEKDNGKTIYYKKDIYKNKPKSRKR
jgi:hypothetical protein